MTLPQFVRGLESRFAHHRQLAQNRILGQPTGQERLLTEIPQIARQYVGRFDHVLQPQRVTPHR